MNNASFLSKQTLIKYKIEIIIFLTVFIVYSFFTFLKILNHLPVQNLAADQYFQIANNLINSSIFSLDGLSPTALRMPGYPFFLTILFRIFHNWWAILLVQNMISALTALFIYLISKKWLSFGYAITASFIWALEPYAIDSSQQFLTETLYTFILVSSVLFFLKYKDFIGKKIFITSILGLMLAILTYIKPVSLFLPIIYALSLIKNNFSKKTFIQITSLLFVYIALLFPWAFRNYSLFGSWQLSADNASSFYITILDFQAKKEGIGTGPSDIPAQSEFPKFAESGNLSKTNQEFQRGISFVISNSFSFSKFYSKKLIKSVTVTSWWGSIRNSIMGKAGEANYHNKVNNALINFDWGEISNFSSKEIVAAIIMIFGAIFWAIILLLSFIGVIYLFKISPLETRPVLILSVGIIAYLILSANLAAPSAMPRYRLPASPFMIIFAITGFSYLIKKISPFGQPPAE